MTTDLHPEKKDLKSLNREELTEFFTSLGLASYRSDQVLQWMYQKGVYSFDEMTNLSKDLRAQLDEIAQIRTIKPVIEQVAKDKTTKFLFELHDGHRIEAVLIPEFFDDGVADRLTVCVSSQVGCVFGCSFCATGKMGLHRSLEVGEIVDQLVHINNHCLENYGKRINNAVYMGMGEPFHNYENVVESAHIVTDKYSIGLSPKRITISTVGLTKMITRFGDEEQPFRLAISLHAPNDNKRDRIMPINNSLNLKNLRESLQHYHRKTGMDITYEYLLFDNFNDGTEDALQLADIAKWIPSKINIIMYNNVLGVHLKRAREDRLNAFIRTLSKQQVRATVRRSRGDDIDAGCGQLAIREGGKKGKTIAKN
jgi:23S rRNA (adenine2503-C2)-methyltransferase